MFDRTDTLDAACAHLPGLLAEFVSAGCGGLLEVPFAALIHGTLVMADVSGFTALSERLARSGDEGAERLTEVINGFFGRMLGLASGLGGDTLGFGGDAILLLFRGEDHARRAVAASLDMLAATEKIAAVRVGGARVKLGMSVGAHTASFLFVVAGDPGERLQLLVCGPETERVAAAEAMAERGDLVVSHETARVLRDGYVTSEVDGFVKVARSADGASRWDGAPHRDGSDWAAHASTDDGFPSALLPFVPPWVAEATRAGTSVQRSTPEHRRAVVIFVNVIGIDEVLRDGGPEAAAGELQAYVMPLVRLAQKHHGFLVSSDISTDGVKLIVTFGAPVAHEYAAANAARFVLELDAETRVRAGRLGHRIGVNGGHVFAGEVGPDFRRQYTVMGDEVNLAARLMSAARPGEILASRSFADHAGTAFCTRELAPIRVKGKAEPVAVCVLEEERLEGGEVGNVHGALVGREAELATILGAWSETLAGRGRTVVVEGEPGLGKTRLLEAAIGGMGGAACVTRAACHEHLQAVPFAPWREVLFAIFRTSHEKTESERTAAVARRLRSLAPEMVEFGSLLNPLLGLRLPEEQVVMSLDPRGRRERLLALIARVVAAVGGEGERGGAGHAVLIEDVHWADESSIELIGHLAGRVSREAVLLVVSRRPEGPALSIGSDAVTIALSELTLEESTGLVREALCAPELPDAVGEIVHAKTRGNPLFLEEVIHSLQAPGVLDRILGASSVALAVEMAGLEIPDRVQGLLMSRIDRLPPDAREVLKASSVMGRVIDPAVLEDLDDELLRPASLEQTFAGLAASGLIARDLEPDRASFVFRHALVQEVAYESLPYVRRRDLHGRIARRLEATLSPPDHGLLVHHYRNAADRPKTLVHAAKAAEGATAVYAFAEAVDYLDLARAQVLARSAAAASLRSRLEELAGDNLESVARHDAAVARYAAARRRWRRADTGCAPSAVPADSLRIDDVEARDADLCRKIAVALERRHAGYRRALLWLDRAMRSLTPGRPVLEARLRVTRSVVEFRLGNYRESLRGGEEGLELARRVGDEALLAYALAMIANPCVGLGLIPRAIEASEEAVALYARVGDLGGEASGHANLAACYQLAGDLTTAVRHHEFGLQLHQRLGYRTGVAICRTNLGEVLTQVGRADEAVEHLECVVDEWKTETVPAALMGFAHVVLSRAELRRGGLKNAADALEKGFVLLRQAGAEGLLLEADLQLAELQLAQDRACDAEETCAAVLHTARAAAARIIEARCLYLLMGNTTSLKQRQPPG